MFHDNVDKNKYLYHFTSHTTALEHILPSGNLRLSPYIYMNDPRERQNWRFGFSGSLDNDEFFKMQDELNSILKSNTKLICFTKDMVGSEDYFMEHDGRGYSHPRMWAQYGGNHTGVCLMFDKTILEKVIDDEFSQRGLIHHGFVNYGARSLNSHYAFNSINSEEIQSLGLKLFSKQHLNKYYKELFFEKMLDWKDESEYRWVFFSNEDRHYEVFKFQDALVGIILGVDFPPVYETIIESYCKKSNIHVIRMDWYNGKPNILPVYTPGMDQSDFRKVLF
ncbi:hypothetical protein JOC75_004001 [Metabacillus crassostreae]|uniref:DUF2971 domain-containing protein n=1 Tax=Metabacillus crassostreae TaxID=929098 RepID=UPI00195E3E80|nr:DUF2971 domain-containing protein [Metabacillus crassostreae]MBM7605973.1 hypothetical protein [Metabacillus crassostreae]